MSWARTADLLRGHLAIYCQQCAQPGDLSDLPWFRSLHAREEQYRVQVDFICQEFIFSGKWRKMNKLQANLVAYRFAWAIKLAHALEAAFPASHSHTFVFPQDLNDAQILHWLLIDTWSTAPKSSSHGEGPTDGIVVALVAPLTAPLAEEPPRRRDRA